LHPSNFAGSRTIF